MPFKAILILSVRNRVFREWHKKARHFSMKSILEASYACKWSSLSTSFFYTGKWAKELRAELPKKPSPTEKTNNTTWREAKIVIAHMSPPRKYIIPNNGKPAFHLDLDVTFLSAPLHKTGTWISKIRAFIPSFSNYVSCSAKIHWDQAPSQRHTGRRDQTCLSVFMGPLLY